MRKLISLTILSVFGFLANAQEYSNNYIGSPEFNNFWDDLKYRKQIEGEKELEYEGNPYLFETENAKLRLNTGQEVKNLTLRYNVYNDQMEIKKDQSYYLIPKEKVFSHLILDEHHFHLKVFKINNKKRTGYFESIVSDSLCSLYVKHNVFLKEASEPKPYQDAKLPTFVSKPYDLFITFNDGLLLPIKNKKDFLELVPKHQKELTAFIKKNNTKFKKSESVRQLVEYYNSL
ncbi:hypothetical protein [Carboxylicivirga sp. RSCT41]|uniref:hypothetical protein n=1 Tax=Carboxylicivirga agarovorans TaxID=3417570 RepID=UPI003D352064